MSKKHHRARHKLSKKSIASRTGAGAISKNVSVGRAKSSTSQLTFLSLSIIAVCVIVLAVHWPALSCRALSFDDPQYLTENVLVRHPGWNSARRFLVEILEPSSVEGYYQPLTMISLMVDYALGGRPDNLMPFHRTSLALHLANTALVIVLLYLLFGRVWAAAAVGLLFGVHPMTVESICWVCDRKTLLAAFFSVWCLIFYVRFARKKGRGFFAGALVMYFLALMAKPTSTPLPMLLLLMDYWPLRRLSRRAVMEKVPFFVIGGVMAVVTVVSQSRTADLVPSAGYGIGSVPLVLCHNIVFYLYKIAWPINLSSHYAFPEPLGLSHPMVFAGVAGTCILFLLLLVSLRRTRAAVTGWLFFFIAILPAMQMLRFSNVIASDKFAYLPSVGLLMMIASFLVWLCDAGIKRVVIILVVLVLAGAESVATRRYLVVWRDTIGLYEHMLSLTPNSVLVHYNLGTELQALKRDNEAIEHYRRAIEIKPDYVEAHYNLGNALKLQKKLKPAIYHYKQALEARPGYVEVMTNMANALSMQGKSSEAIDYYRRALAIKSDYPEAHSNLAWELKEAGEMVEALEHFGLALQSQPDLVPSLFGMGWILGTDSDRQVRNAEKAIELAKHAAELTNYQNAAILDLLAIAYAARGQFDEAVPTAEAALKLASAGQLGNYIRKRLELYRQGKPYRETVREKDVTSDMQQ